MIAGAYNSQYPKIMLLGDSLTEEGGFHEGGFSLRITQHFTRIADVINRGYNGYNTTWVEALLPHILATAGTVSVSVLLLGTNDCSVPGGGAGTHVSLSQYASNMNKMTDNILDTGSKLILVTPPPIGEEIWHRYAVSRGWAREEDPADRSNASMEPYLGVIHELVKSRSDLTNTNSDVTTTGSDVMLFDFNKQIRESGRDISTFLHEDGLHLSAEGNAVLAAGLIEMVERAFPEWREKFAEFLDIDPGNLESLFVARQWNEARQGPRPMPPSG